PGAALPMVTTILVTSWLILVEITHRTRKSELGVRLAKIDRGLRYLLLAGLMIIGAGILLQKILSPTWLGWKLVLFALVITAGVAIRFQVIKFYQSWQRLREHHHSPEDNETIQQVYVRSRRILLFLWFCISLMVLLSIGKPA
ncbi:MAG: hypothetical protein AAF438_22195, partial [Pseudomonadota bacterium]